MGRAEALARAGKLDEAKAQAEGLSDKLDEWRILTVVAAVGLEKSPADASGVKAVLAPLEDEDDPLSIHEHRPSGKPSAPWLLYRLAQLAAADGQAETALTLAKHIRLSRVEEARPESFADLQARAQLDVLRGRLERSKDKASDDVVKEVNPKQPASTGARLAVARHNARRGDLSDKTVAGWSPETDRPLGWVGIALGLQDAQR